MTTGIGESFLADKIKDWEENLPDFLSLAYLPQYGLVRLRLSGRHENADFLHETLDRETEKLSALIRENVFAMDDVPIENVVFHLLINKGATFATAESCTGGNMAHRITMIPGSSDVFKGTAVTYATESKTNVLGVQKQVIDEFGVVSQQVVEAMAEGVRRVYGADYGCRYYLRYGRWHRVAVDDLDKGLRKRSFGDDIISVHRLVGKVFCKFRC